MRISPTDMDFLSWPSKKVDHDHFTPFFQIFHGPFCVWLPCLTYTHFWKPHERPVHPVVSSQKSMSFTAPKILSSRGMATCACALRARNPCVCWWQICTRRSRWFWRRNAGEDSFWGAIPLHKWVYSHSYRGYIPTHVGYNHGYTHL